MSAEPDCIRLLDIQAALCLSEAGRPGEAAQRYSYMVEAEPSTRDRAYFSILMATSLALSGEPDEAARVGCAALPIAVATSSRRSVQEARMLVGALAPWQQRRQVQQLHEALRLAESASAG